MHFAALALLLAIGVYASNSSDYFEGLSEALIAANLTSLNNVIKVVHGSSGRGAALVDGLFSETNFTVYAPSDSAFKDANLSDPTASDQLESLLAYHIVPASLNSTDVSPPRQHTVARTLLRTDTIKLPNNQTQVIVLEEAPAGAGQQGEKRILIRGDGWNASSVAGMVTHSNLFIQPIDKILQVPSPLVRTLETPLVSRAPNGFSAFKTLLEQVSAGSALEKYDGVTAFVPIDAAIQAEQGRLSVLTPSEAGAVLYNHFINGSVFYSQLLTKADNVVTSSGHKLRVMANDTGLYVVTANSTARILRSDVPIANGVIHVIDTVLFTTDTDQEAALAAATSAAALGTGTPTVPIPAVITNTNVANSTTSTGSAQPYSAALHSIAWTGAGLTITTSLAAAILAVGLVI